MKNGKMIEIKSLCIYEVVDGCIVSDVYYVYLVCSGYSIEV